MNLVVRRRRIFMKITSNLTAVIIIFFFTFWNERFCVNFFVAISFVAAAEKTIKCSICQRAKIEIGENLVSQEIWH